MNEDQEFSEGQQIATDLMKGLGVSEKDLVTRAYMDPPQQCTSAAHHCQQEHTP